MPDPAALNRAIAEEVRSLLARRRISQKALQDDLGWSRARVNRLVRGEQAWGILELLAVCDYLDVDLAVLLSTAKAAAVQMSDERQVLESVLTEQERGEIDAARERMRPKEEQSGDDRKGPRRAAR